MRSIRPDAIRTALCLLTLVGILIAASALQTSAAQTESGAASGSDADKQQRRATLVDARDLLTKARSHHRAGDYELAIAQLDEAIDILNEIVVTSKNRTVRSAAGQVFRASASLRLSCSLKLDKLNAHYYLIGPPAASDEVPVEMPLVGPVLELPGEPSPTDDYYPDEDWESEDDDLALEDEDRELSVVHEASLAWVEMTGGRGLLGEELPLDDDLLPGYEPVGGHTENGSIELVHNKRVQKWIDYYTGRGRRHFLLYRERAELYQAWMQEILVSEGMPADLVHLVYVESGFNNKAVSRSRAVGQWQFIYGTGKLFNLRINSWVDDRRNPEKATRAAARYLKHLYSLFGDWQLALASYNCGEGRTIRTMARQGTDDYWKLRLPRETRNYIPKFMAVLAICRNPELYGFAPLEDRRLQFDTVQLPGPVDLKAVAQGCSISLDSLRALNPSFRRFAAPPEPSGVVTVRVPPRTGEQLVGDLVAGRVVLPRMMMPKEPTYRLHRVRRGETLIGIAQRYRVRTRELARINNIRNVHRLRIGQRLQIPERESIRYATAIGTPLDKPATAGGASAAAREKPSPAKKYSGTKTIRIRRGDTLIGLAKKYDTDVTTLRALNGLRAKQKIIAGGRLKVPTP
jgi:membrane-bound lytic murein transglycosylase D